MCRVQGIGPDLSFSAQPDSTMEIYLCTPWQYCRIYGLDLLTFSTVTGMRVGRQASARRVQAPLYFIEIYIYIYIYIYFIVYPHPLRGLLYIDTTPPRAVVSDVSTANLPPLSPQRATQW